MALLADLTEKVNEVVSTLWGNIPDARVIPTPEDLTFGNTAERLEVVILYADIQSSTSMVDALSDVLAAEYYKTFLHCAAKIIKANVGVIQAYDGDRVMAVFVGSDRADNAVRSALQINYAVERIINPAFTRYYVINPWALKHTVGIDAGKVLVAKTGVRVDSDLVWVGPPANYAAKFNSFPGSELAYPLRISRAVLLALSDYLVYDKNRAMVWTGPYHDLKHEHFRSNYMMEIL